MRSSLGLVLFNQFVRDPSLGARHSRSDPYLSLVNLLLHHEQTDWLYGSNHSLLEVLLVEEVSPQDPCDPR